MQVSLCSWIIPLFWTMQALFIENEQAKSRERLKKWEKHVLLLRVLCRQKRERERDPWIHRVNIDENILIFFLFHFKIDKIIPLTKTLSFFFPFAFFYHIFLLTNFTKRNTKLFYIFLSSSCCSLYQIYVYDCFTKYIHVTYIYWCDRSLLSWLVLIFNFTYLIKISKYL